jgi:hypothetical protein
MESKTTATTTELIETGEKHDVLGRRLTPGERRAELLAAFQASGLTQAAFARREGITYSTFCTWAQAERAAGRLPVAKPGRVRSKPAVTAPPVRFVEAGPSGPINLSVSSTPGLEVRLPDGTVLRGSSAVELAKLLRSLRG